ncbi:AEC family transporter [Caminibacter pacificus]|jgi:predicted permease
MASLLFVFLLGYIFKKIKGDYSKEIIEIITNIVMPIFVFYYITKLEITPKLLIISAITLLSISLGIIISFIISLILKLDKPSIGALMLVTSFGSSSFVGIPIIKALYPSKFLTYIIFYGQTNFLFFLIFGSIIISLTSPLNKKNDLNFIKKLLKTPTFDAFLFALILKPLKLNVDFLKIVADSLIFLAILTIGMRFEFNTLFKNIKIAFLVNFLKMFLIPIIVFLIVKHFLGINTALKIAIIASAMPSMALAVIYGLQAKLKEEILISVMSLGILLSFIWIPIFTKII